MQDTAHAAKTFYTYEDSCRPTGAQIEVLDMSDALIRILARFNFGEVQSDGDIETLIRDVMSALEGRRLRTLRVVGHGAPGLASFGRTNVSPSNLTEHEVELLRSLPWTPDAVLELSQCMVGYGVQGEELARQLATRVGVTVVAPLEEQDALSLSPHGPTLVVHPDGSSREVDLPWRAWTNGWFADSTQ
ncbi:MAG: DUF4347 domain-containing protein [Myxococcales bacterium]|nr:DUF4347 domain-containing protein [Myxococcales bacterium]